MALTRTDLNSTGPPPAAMSGRNTALSLPCGEMLEGPHFFSSNEGSRSINKTDAARLRLQSLVFFGFLFFVCIYFFLIEIRVFRNGFDAFNSELSRGHSSVIFSGLGY